MTVTGNRRSSGKPASERGHPPAQSSVTIVEDLRAAAHPKAPLPLGLAAQLGTSGPRRARKDRTAFAGLAAIKRGLSRDEAAYVVGVGTTLFDKMVEDGRMPKCARINGRVLWDRVQLDRAIDRLFDSDDDKGVEDPYAEVQT